MSNDIFKVGDRVSPIRDFADSPKIGEIGTIVGFYPTDRNWVWVRWDIPADNYHDCDGLCEDDHGYGFYDYDLTKVEELPELDDMTDLLALL